MINLLHIYLFLLLQIVVIVRRRLTDYTIVTDTQTHIYTTHLKRLQIRCVLLFFCHFHSVTVSAVRQSNLIGGVVEHTVAFVAFIGFIAFVLINFSLLKWHCIALQCVIMVFCLWNIISCLIAYVYRQAIILYLNVNHHLNAMLVFVFSLCFGIRSIFRQKHSGNWPFSRLWPTKISSNENVMA